MFWKLVLAAAALGAVYYRWARRRFYRLAAEIPTSLKSYPIIGHAYMFLGSSEDRMTAFQKLGRVSNQQGGLSSFWLGHKFFVCATDPPVIEVVTKTCLEKEKIMTKFIQMVIGNGFIFAPVNIWHLRRKISAPFYNLKNLNKLVAVFDEKSSIMNDLIQAEVGGGDFPIWKYMTTYTADTVCETAAGTKMTFQQNPDHYILKAIDDMSHMVAERIYQPWLHPDFIYKNLPVYKQFQHHLKRGCDFVDEIIQKRRNKSDVRAKDVNENDYEYTDFLETIIQSSGGEVKGYNDLELREELMVIMIAGNDTTAVASSFTAVLLSRYPEVQEKVYQELQEVFGDSERPVTSADLHQLKYLEAVIKESLRLYTPVPLVMRELQQDLVLPSGTTLVEGTVVLINMWGTHRNPEYWGEDAELFRPERFLKPLSHPAMFIPFSYSIRGCIGATYAMLSAKTALANLLRRYRLLPPAGARAADLARPLPVKFSIMMKAVDNFIVRVEERRK